MKATELQVSQSVKLAGIVVLVVVFYFLASGLFQDRSEADNTAVAPTRFAVLVDTIGPESWQDEITIRGRTAAEKKVILRAETAGPVTATPIEAGAVVAEGDVLCRLAVDARRAALAEAEASLAKAQLDYDAALRLSEEGFRAATGVAAAKAARDQASALVERNRLELSKTEIRAPFDGIFDNRDAELGDFLRVGDPCGTIIKSTPFLVVGAVAERDVSKITVGDRGEASLATGEVLEGRVRFIAAAADPSTRTFNVELEVPNEDAALRDGVTAEFTVYAHTRDAHHAPRAALVLNDAGDIGVRTVTENGEVAFLPVQLIGEDADGVWVDGLEGDIQLIVRGQEFVAAGQMVDIATPNAAPDAGS